MHTKITCLSFTQWQKYLSRIIQKITFSEHNHSAPSAKEKTFSDFINNKNNLPSVGTDYSVVFFFDATVILIFCLFPTIQKCPKSKFRYSDKMVFLQTTYVCRQTFNSMWTRHFLKNSPFIVCGSNTLLHNTLS